MHYAERVFRGGTIRSDGASATDHTDAAARIAAKAGTPLRKVEADEPEVAEMPLDLLHVWEWFDEICDGLAITGMAPAAVTWTDVRDWAALTWRSPEPWEVRTLVRLGTLKAHVESQTSEAGQK